MFDGDRPWTVHGLWWDFLVQSGIGCWSEIRPWVFACMLLLDLNSMFDVWRMRL